MKDSEVTDFAFNGVDAPATVAGLKTAVASYQGLRINWNAVSGASGYEVSRSLSKGSGYSTIQIITSGSVCSYTNVSGLKTGTAYYYKVRAFKTVEGRTFYGNWSAAGKGVPALKTTAIKKITSNFFQFLHQL